MFARPELCPPTKDTVMITKRQLLGSAALAAAATIPGFSPVKAAPSRPGFLAAKDIAEAGFIFGLPIVMNYGVMYDFVINKNSGQYRAPFNTINNAASVFTYKDTAVVTPNSDTPYSLLWLDLRAEPMVISVPAIDRQRYYSVQLCDGNTYNYGYIGSSCYRQPKPAITWWSDPTGTGLPQRASRRRSAPARSSRSRSFARSSLIPPTSTMSRRYRPATMGSRYRPISSSRHHPAHRLLRSRISTRTSRRQNFFEYLDFALQFAPAAPNEAEIRAKLASIGIGPGKTFNFKDLPLKQKLEIGLGMKQGQSKIEEAVANAGKNINGWHVGGVPGDGAFYNGDWLLRAAAAQAGIYGNSPEEAMYPFTRKDSTGRALDGSKNNYTLTFPADQLPPVNAFWSVTMYDGKTQFLIKNPINRYLINSPMLPGMKKNADGSLTLYIQNKSPGAEREANWLPAPDGPIYLVMRLYWPKETPPSILPPAKERGSRPAWSSQRTDEQINLSHSACGLISVAGNILLSCGI